MKARKELFEIWASKNDRELYVEGRLAATYYEVYTIIPGREEEYRETLFDDSDVSEGPCTFRQTTHFGMLIGARITQIVTNYLSNKLSKMEIANIPFCVSEIGEMVMMTTR